MLEFIKNFVCALKATREQKKLFKRLKIGDVVWAKMPLNKHELDSISETHRIRPYFIAGIDKFNIYAYQMSSKKNAKLRNYEYYKIISEKYGKKRDSYISLKEICKVPINNLCSYYSQIDINDKMSISKRLQILRNRNYDVPFFIYERFSIVAGDLIFSNGSKYLIYAHDNQNWYCHRIYRKRINLDCIKIKINNKNQFINFKQQQIISKSENDIKIIDILSKNDFEKLMYMKTNHTKNKAMIKQDNATCYQVGTIVQLGLDRVMYLFSKNTEDYGVDLLMYKISPNFVKIKNGTIIEQCNLDILKDVVTYLYINKALSTKEIKRLYKKYCQNE